MTHALNERIISNKDLQTEPCFEGEGIDGGKEALRSFLRCQLLAPFELHGTVDIVADSHPYLLSPLHC